VDDGSDLAGLSEHRRVDGTAEVTSCPFLTQTAVPLVLGGTLLHCRVRGTLLGPGLLARCRHQVFLSVVGLVSV
jgi:hypothetical protein